MFNNVNSKLAVLSTLFLLTGGLLFVTSNNFAHKDDKAVHQAGSIIQALSDIPGWKLVGSQKLDQSVRDGLHLDDYIFATYSDGDNEISLYIGYYWNTGKIGAAHDPLVCFPGQGWQIVDKKRGRIPINHLKTSVSYTELLIRRGDDMQLVIYWFQAADKAVPDTFQQKLAGFYNKLRKLPEDNAFVRVMSTANDYQVSKEAALSFIQAFYPRFLQYIKMTETPISE